MSSRAAVFTGLILISFASLVDADIAWIDSLELLTPAGAESTLIMATGRFIAEREAVVRRLATLIESTSCESLSARGLLESLNLIASLGGRTAARTLLAKIKYHNVLVEGFRGYDESAIFAYPAAVALSSLGLPAVEGTTWMLTHTDDELELRLCTGVVEIILGRDIASCVLKNALEENPQAKQRGNLEKAMSLLEREESENLLTMRLD